MRLVDEYRLVAFLARRQYGKTTTFAKIALKKMMKRRNHTVIFGSAKLNLSREIVRAEAAILQAAIGDVVEDAKKNIHTVQIVDAQTNKAPDSLSSDDFADLFEAQRLEFRYYHTRSSYSRTKVVALRADTVGETGDLMCDEIGRVANWREVWEAVNPIVAANPEFRVCLATTPPPDDAHYSFEMLCPPVGMEFTPNPEGTLFESDMGFMVLRLDAWDAYADNLPIYDLKTGAPRSPDEDRQHSHDKDAWDRNFGVKFVLGGTSACSLLSLETAQTRGVGKCEHRRIDDDKDFYEAMVRLPQLLGEGKLGVGIDLATTTKQKSNPTSVSIAEAKGLETIVPMILTWKTSDPDIAEERIKLVVQCCNVRQSGGRVRKIEVDSTNERYFAMRLKKNLRHLAPVELVVGSETITKPGLDAMTMKQYLGNNLIADLDDNLLTLPAARYVREDWRLVKKERGQLVCDPDADGRHGDTFDSTKMARDAIRSKSGEVEAAGTQVGSYGQQSYGIRERCPMRAPRDEPLKEGAVLV